MMQNIVSGPSITPNSEKNQISQVLIKGEEYLYDGIYYYYTKTGKVLKMGHRKVKALFPWKEGTYLAHIEDRIMDTPTLLSENGNEFWLIPLGFMTAIEKILKKSSNAENSFVS